MKKQKICIDILDNYVYEYIYAKQYDIGRQVDFIVQEDGQPFDLKKKGVVFQLKKPDGTVIINDCTCDGNIATITLSKQTTAIFGSRIPYQLRIFESEDVCISTITGYLKIDESVVQADDLESSDEFNTLSDLLDGYIAASVELAELCERTETAQAKAQVSETNAKESEVNAKESETNAKTSETNAETFANNALLSAENAKASEDQALEYKNSIESKSEECSNYTNIVKSYAVGTEGTVRENDDTDNSKYYYQLSKNIAQEFTTLLMENKTIFSLTEPDLPLKENDEWVQYYD